MKAVSRDKVVHHRSRADAFLNSMKLVSAEQRLSKAVPLLAIHSAISLADAVLIETIGKRSSDRNHLESVKELTKVCSERRRDPAGIDHLKWLLSRKTDLVYGDKRLDSDNDIKGSILRAERFAGWVYNNFPEVARSGSED